MHLIRALLLDDDDTDAASFRRALDEAGIETVVASSLTGAENLLRMLRPHIVFGEVAAGGAELPDLVDRIHGEGVPSVLTSREHHREPDLKNLAEGRGAHGHLMRPFGARALMDCLRSHLGAETLLLCAKNRGEQEDPSGDPEGVRGLLREASQDVPAPSAMRPGPPAFLLAQLRHARATGLFYVLDGHTQILFHLDEGIPHCARTNLPRMRLTHILLEEGHIGSQRIQEARELTRSLGGTRWLEEVLIGLEAIDDTTLESAVQSQVEALLTRVLGRQQARCCYLPSQVAVPASARGPFDPVRHLYDAIRSIEDEGLLREHLPAGNLIPRREASWQRRADALGLSAFERELLSLVDGKKTLREICGIGRRTLGNVEAHVLALWAGGLFRLREPAEEKRALPAPSPKVGERQGDLAHEPFVHVLERLHEEAATGTLTVEHEGRRKWIYLREGEVVFARSNLHEDRIGRVLVEAELVGEQDVEQAARLSGPRRSLRLGGVLMERGLVTFEQLWWAGLFQVRRILQGLFTWQAGAWTFRPGDLPVWTAAAVAFETGELILEGIRQCPAAVLHRLGPVPDSLAAAPGRLEGSSLRLSEIEEAVLAWIEQPGGVADLLEVGLGSEEEVLRAVHGLLGAGLLRQEVPEGSPPAPETV